MNAVISLCHFCELHGPSVLFCTQAFHEHYPVIGFSSLSPTSTDKDKLSSSGKNKRSYYGPPELLFSMQTANDLNSTPDKGPEICEGCSSMPHNLKRFLCNDHEAKVSYISSQNPMHPELFSLVRQACVRSLSCEVCPGREGPIYFGDNERGHVLSYTFFMKDSHARGFQRWYSIIIVMMDKIFLLNSWTFLLKHIQKLVAELQAKASKVYDVEQSECSHRMLRLNSVTRMTPDNFRRQRGNAKARSLTELTGDVSVFPYIHLWFTWILRAGGCRISERLLEGLPSEDTVVDLETQEETEEGFIKVHTKTVVDEFKATIRESGSSQTISNDTNLSANISAASALLSDLLEQTSIGQQSKESTVSSLRELYNVIGKEMFLVLCYHTVIGNQIILRGSSSSLIKSIIDCLQVVLPRGCCHPVYYSDQYVDSWKCNFLGVQKDVPIPEHVLSSDLHLCVDVKDSVENQDKSLSWTLTLHHCTSLPEKLPQVLCDVERLVHDEVCTERSMEACIRTLKEVWMNKVKVLFAFSRAGQHPVQETQKLLHVLGAQEQDKLFLKFWMTGLSSQYKMHVLSSSVQQGTQHEPTL